MSFIFLYNQPVKNVLVTGVSSGIGNILTKLLINKGFKVWGIARRKKLLEQLDQELLSGNFLYTVADVADEKYWIQIIKKMKRQKFIPDIVIFNAAIYKNDLINIIDLDKLRQMMEVNFFSILIGIKTISKNYSNELHFITISSTSAFKGNFREGIGYAASKSALSIAFECLFQKYHNSRLKFTTVFFGPVKTDMIRFTKYPPMTLTPIQAAEAILKAIKNGKPFYYYPKTAFIILSIMRFLPKQTFFWLWKNLQKNYTKKDSEKS